VSNFLSTGETLRLLEEFKNTARDFAARAGKLAEEYRARSNRQAHQRETQTATQAQGASEALAAAEAEHLEARQRLEKIYQQRKTLIGKAYQSSKELGLKRVEDQMGAKKYELQKKMLQAERDREASLTKAATDLKEFKTAIAAQQQTLGNSEVAAQKLFRGYGRFRRVFAAAYQTAEVNSALDHTGLFDEMTSLLQKTQDELGSLRRKIFLRFFKYLPLLLLVVAAGFGAVTLLNRAGEGSPGASGTTPFPWKLAAEGTLAAGALALVLRFILQQQAQTQVKSISNNLARARRTHDAALEKSDAFYRSEVERIKQEFTDTTRWADQQLKDASTKAGQSRVSCRMSSDEKTVRVAARLDRLQKVRIARFENDYSARLKALKAQAEDARLAFSSAVDESERKFKAEQKATLQSLTEEWTAKIRPIYSTLAEAAATSDSAFPPWNAAGLQKWSAPGEFAQAAHFGNIQANVEEMAETTLSDKGLILPGPPTISAPLLLKYPEQGSILIETSSTGHEAAIGALNNIILRLLSVAPPGRLNFTIIDPVGLGQNFAGVMHLADYEEQLINNRIWTQSGQIEQRLADINEHMEKVIQMYLRNEYATIAEYNEQAGVIAEKYYFLVIADFPANFTDVAAKRLLSIASSGARCGVYTLIHWDTRQPLPADFTPDDLRKSGVVLNFKGNNLVITGQPLPGTQADLELPPPAEKAIELIHTIGKASRDSSRVEVPFSQVAPPDNQLWTEKTTTELRVPIGRTGATKLQYLEIGKGTRQHGLIAGKTGSGKSTLFHVMITNLALWCSPQEVEFYLVDFKKGVEFKCYGTWRLPHARVVAIESDREFGLSVFQRVDDELRRRGDLFRKLGVQDIPGYKRAGGKEPMPRSLLLIDEFQEFFVEDDKVSQTASLLLDRIVRQGRAFGIHVLLGSQTLGGAYTVARTTLGQMVIRIALQCNEADAYLIMDDSNPAPRLLSRPGEGIYNDTAGTVEGNSPFQVVWLPDQVRDEYLRKVRDRADQEGERYDGPIVFEGNAPADVRENLALSRLLQATPAKPPAAGRVWLGAPNSIKGPTEVVFQPQSGNHLLIVGQREEAILAMFAVSMVALAAQYPAGAVKLIVCDASPPDSPHRQYLDRVLQTLPHPVTLSKQGDLGEILKGLVADMKQRTQEETSVDAPPTYLFIHDLQRFNKLRFEEEFGFSTPDPDAPPNPAILLNELIAEGARVGFHVIASCDTYNNVNRFLSRKALSEFELRILFQMSANDSANLIDNPKASTLGLHRALFFNEQEGYLETFRPYALPDHQWLEQTTARAVGVRE
jgi:S-DNA-T family DNA segregation ATPase FtsK/SpoIIIE